jgi:glycosyltransferase involved in cell wall biosynthesis
METLVIVPTRNCALWIKDCIKTITSQSFKDFKCVIVDDCSDDDSVKAINNAISHDERFSLIVNPQRFGPLFARFVVPKELCTSKTLVITIDGDDKLANPFVFEKIADAFDKGNLVIYGKMQVVFEDKRLGAIYGDAYSIEVKTNKSFRNSKWLCGQPRCFSSSILKYIDEKYLKWENKWIPAATDKALFYCLMEIAGNRIHFINEILYEYHWRATHHTNADIQNKYQAILQTMTPIKLIKQ